MSWDVKVNEELKWTANVRDRLYTKANFAQKNNLLAISCGTGELLKEIGIKFNLKLYGIDDDRVKIDYASMNLAKNQIDAYLKQAKILNSNFQNNFFDIIITNFYFVWKKNLNEIFTEIHRILKHEGIFLILSEPDYGGLIEFPNTNLRKEIINNIQKMGGDPKVGRKLNQLFLGGFMVYENFCSSFPWIPNFAKEELYKYLEFFTKILNPKKFNSKLMKESIDKDIYFLFLPYFSSKK